MDRLNAICVTTVTVLQLLFGLAAPVSAQSSVCYRVDSPKGGEVLLACSTCSIEWDITTCSCCDDPGDRLEYSIDGGGTWVLIIEGELWPPFFDWTVPNIFSDRCLVRICGTIDDRCDVSDSFFTIVRDSSQIPSHPDDIYWHTGISQAIGGTANSVCAATAFDEQLVVGGRFTSLAGVIANHISSWDGYSWDLLSSGMGGAVSPRVDALMAYNGILIAGGNFTTAGETSANHVSAWNGATWSSLGAGVGGAVYALAAYDRSLIAGGSFTNVGGASVSNIAYWDGIKWTPLGAGLNGPVYVLAVYNGNLIAGGAFTEAGGMSASGIASWDGIRWSSVGSGVNQTVRALTAYGGNLIAGGWFTSAGTTDVSRIASWNDSTWSQLGSGMNGTVHSLTVHDGSLIAGGAFTTVDGMSASRIASWDGISWSPLGSGVNGNVTILTVYDGDLIAGGEFTIAGNRVSPYLARWHREPTDVELVEPTSLPRDFMLHQNYPNPFNPIAEISFSIPEAADVRLDIFNVMGQQVTTLVNWRCEAGDHAVTWDAAGVSSGIYFYRLQANEFAATKKMVLLR